MIAANKINVLSALKKSLMSYTTNRLNSTNNSIGFIGTGNMAKAIIQGLIITQRFQANNIYVTDADQKYLEHLKTNVPFFQENKINFTNNNEIFKQTNNVMLCVKPQNMKSLLEENSAHISKDHLLISIAAGTQLNNMQKCLDNPARIIRIMTNTAALIQEGCSVYSKGEYATNDDAKFVSDMLESIGTCEGEIKENQMDVVTALSGSGPAYMFLILESLSAGAERMGMDKDMAIRLAAQTMLGAASMVKKELNAQDGKHIMQMKEEVCSPGGTTINGIAQLEKHKVRSALIDCIESATKRAVELNIK